MFFTDKKKIGQINIQEASLSDQVTKVQLLGTEFERALA